MVASRNPSQHRFLSLDFCSLAVVTLVVWFVPWFFLLFLCWAFAFSHQLQKTIEP